MTVQCALLKCYTILGYSTETVLLIFPFLQTNITVSDEAKWCVRGPYTAQTSIQYTSVTTTHHTHTCRLNHHPSRWTWISCFPSRLSIYSMLSHHVLLKKKKVLWWKMRSGKKVSFTRGNWCKVVVPGCTSCPHHFFNINRLPRERTSLHFTSSSSSSSS